jgi:hypothetical protein
MDIAQERLRNQYISAPMPQSKKGPGEGSRNRAEDVVRWLVAVQAQDYAGAKWALGLRLQGAADDDIEEAFQKGTILRTHLLRPTWHFVTPADIRWLLVLTAPRVHATNAHMYRRLELDDALFRRSHDILGQALQGGNELTRDELRATLQNAGIHAGTGQRLAYIVMRAELDGILCSGARRGRQFTYALLDERAPGGLALSRDEALAELAERYFASRGPATVQDFAKWSGLAAADARAGLEAVKSRLDHAAVEGRDYWFATSMLAAPDDPPRAYLLSVYDEYISGYKDRSAIADADVGAMLFTMGNALTHVVVVDGRIVGSWRRTLSKNEVSVETNIFLSLTEAQQQAISAAARRFGDFVGRRVLLA